MFLILSDENFECDHSVYNGLPFASLPLQIKGIFFARRRIRCSKASSSQQCDRVMQ